jgi:hypothetical protein
VTILEILWLLQNSTWLERYVDLLSVFCAAMTPAAASADGKPAAGGGAPSFGWLWCSRFWRFSAAIS